jgi:hypothetical protein
VFGWGHFSAFFGDEWIFGGEWVSAVESKCTTLGRIKVHQSREGWFLQRLSQCGNVVDGFSATIALKAG